MNMTWQAMVFATLLAAAPGYAASQADTPVSDDAWLEATRQVLEARYAGNPDVRIDRGLIADRKHRTVDVYALATGAAADERVDTFVADAGAGSAGALAVSFASQQDVRDALAFIGMAPGHPVDIASSFYWPKGERVIMSFQWDTQGGTRFTSSVRAEQLILDSRWNETLPELGLRYVGPLPGTPAGAAPIATAFNAQDTLLEVPYLAGDSEAVTALAVNAAFAFEPGQRLRIRLRPELRRGERRTEEYIVQVKPGDTEVEQRLQNLDVSLASPDGAPAATGDFESVYVFLEARVKDGREPYLRFHYDDALTMRSVRNVARFIEQFLIARQIRVEPDDAHFFFTALLPPDDWRDPQRRGQDRQPVEIHWRPGSAPGTGAGEVIQYPHSGSGTVKRLRFSTVEELPTVLQSGAPWQTDGALLMLSPEVSYGFARGLYERIHGDFPNVYVFL